MIRLVATSLAIAGLIAACCSWRTTPTPAINGPSLRDLAEPALRAIDANPDRFGGGYVDRAGTSLHVLYVGQEDEARQELEGLLPDDAAVVWERVDHSYRELDQIRAEIIQLWMSGPRDRISEVSVNVLTNTVLVGTPQPQPDLVAELQRRYGDAVTFAIVPPDEPA